jgi:hypothetical protein
MVVSIKTAIIRSFFSVLTQTRIVVYGSVFMLTLYNNYNTLSRAVANAREKPAYLHALKGRRLAAGSVGQSSECLSKSLCCSALEVAWHFTNPLRE